jgi:ribosomal protein S18 acetylase RimI-like enzyme
MPGASTADSAAPSLRDGREVISSPYCLKLYRSTNIPKRYFEACFSLVEYTSAETYRHSPDFGWNSQRKRDEMREPDMFYLLVLRKQANEDARNGMPTAGKDDEQGNGDASDELNPPKRRPRRGRGAKDSVPPRSPTAVNLDDDLGGFTSFMVTYEAGIPVLYCYELHMHPDMQGRGTGELLMDILHKIGSRIPGLEKTMLTVFAANEGARRFYRRMGYEKDETCPTQMALKSGRTKEWSYLILSRSLQQ